MWAPQVAGGDEPPSVLSDNLPGLAIKPGLSWFSRGSRRLWLEVEVVQRSQIGIASVALSRPLPLRWKAARFRFVINGRGR